MKLNLAQLKPNIFYEDKGDLVDDIKVVPFQEVKNTLRKGNHKKIDRKDKKKSKVFVELDEENVF